KINLKKSPHIGVITNISHNHMDDHDDFNDYVETKKSLLEHQEEEDIAILNYNTKELQTISTASKIYYFSIEKQINEGSYLKGDDLIISKDNSEYKICSKFDLNIPGTHNIANVLAASLAAYLGGVNTKIIRETVTSFKGLKSRIELIREIKGVKYYNDSSACNPDGLRVAIKSFSHPIILIAGGTRKKEIPDEIEQMAEDIVKNKIKVLFLIGEKAQLIQKKVEDKMAETKSKEPFIKICSSLDEAVKYSHDSAKSGDIVIMSPGCESFDMFDDYRDRASQFTKLIQNFPN
ncbi:MAG: UDP-N-acetylmuramoyl-L-alanine--D-glutamate ligase, partial [Parcubacteria group bacterium]|nr:UDP-N-acetylmuramoyl-L-alanine--D-glutamate ligase [Parcubacteria group bacterium]